MSSLLKVVYASEIEAKPTLTAFAGLNRGIKFEIRDNRNQKVVPQD